MNRFPANRVIPADIPIFRIFSIRPSVPEFPEKIGRGVFATALMVLQTNELFVLDLLSMASQPQQVVGRIIMTVNGFSQFLNALRLNVKHYEGDLGPLKPPVFTGPVGPRAAAAPVQPSNARIETGETGEPGGTAANRPGLPIPGLPVLWPMVPWPAAPWGSIRTATGRRHRRGRSPISTSRCGSPRNSWGARSPMP